MASNIHHPYRNVIFNNNLGTINFYGDHWASDESLRCGEPGKRVPSQTSPYPYRIREPIEWSSVHGGEELVEEKKCAFRDVGDAREMVEDTTKYPYNAVAFIEADYHTDDNEMAATGFYCENSLFITAAHNVRDRNLKAANNIKITFGLNGFEDFSAKKQILLNGCDFTVPEEYKKKNR